MLHGLPVVVAAVIVPTQRGPTCRRIAATYVNNLVFAFDEVERSALYMTVFLASARSI
jgi:hypothetical protein